MLDFLGMLLRHGYRKNGPEASTYLELANLSGGGMEVK